MRQKAPRFCSRSRGKKAGEKMVGAELMEEVMSGRWLFMDFMGHTLAIRERRVRGGVDRGGGHIDDGHTSEKDSSLNLGTIEQLVKLFRQGEIPILPHDMVSSQHVQVG